MYKLKILNRNQKYIPGPGGQGTVLYTMEYNIVEGSTITFCKNETLDSATILIQNLTEPMEIEPFDVVQLIGNTNKFSIKTMCVDTYQKEIINLHPKIYNYTISLFSETKLLENIILPNLKITKVWDDNTHTVGKYLRRYLTQYSQKIRKANGIDNRWSFAESSISGLTDISYEFDDVECPEMQWNQPTLREVLTDLMMVKDRIPVLRNNKIGYLDLTSIGQDVTNDEHITFVTESKSSEDCISEIRSELVNVTTRSIEDINNTVLRKEFITFNSTDALLNTDNALLFTTYPIYNLKSIKLIIPLVHGDSDSSVVVAIPEWIEVDLLNTEGFKIIYEEKEWNTMPIYYHNGLIGGYEGHNLNEVETYSLYQNLCFHYVRGSNIIYPFGIALKGLAGFTHNVLESFLHAIIHKKIITPNWYSMQCIIEYETLKECLFTASKFEPQRNVRITMDNQTNSYVDSYKQGFLEYQKANRLGNLNKIINARYTEDESESEMLQLGDIFEDSVIYQIEYHLYNTHTELCALATKGYVLRDYFTGIKAKIRSWKIVDGDEALLRHELVKYYLEFSFNQHQELFGVPRNINKIGEYFLSPLITSNVVNYIKSVAVQTQDIDNNYYPDSSVSITYYEDENLTSFTLNRDRYMMDLSSRVVGNSICFTFGFQDNYWVEKHIAISKDDIKKNSNDGHLEFTQYSNTDIVDSTAGVKTDYYRYTDNNGELISVTWEFITDYNYSYPYNYQIQSGDNWSTGDETFDVTKQIVYNTAFRPAIDSRAMSKEFTFDLGLFKDNSEILQITNQFEYCSETSDIVFTKEFIQRCKAVRTIANNHTFKAYLGEPENYNFRNPQLLIGTSYSVTTTINTPHNDDNIYTSDRIRISISGINDTSLSKTFYITDEDDVLLMVVNQPELHQSQVGSVYFELWLNCLLIRDKAIYDADGININNDYI